MDGNNDKKKNMEMKHCVQLKHWNISAMNLSVL